MQPLVFCLGVLSLAAWSVTALRIGLGVRTIRALPEVPADAGPRAPRLSVVVAARNEAAGIEAAIGSLLELDYPDLEVVAVDDRSSDATGAILDRMSASDPRLGVIHVERLPRGWLGKNHALHRGGERAGGELILFTDGDVVFERTALSRAVSLLLSERLDHLAVAPTLKVPGFWGAAFVSFFSLCFSIFTAPWSARNPRSRSHIGIGAFNLVRASAYRAVGGHAPLAMRPDDDLKLGKLLKRAGFRQDIAFADGLVRVDWYPGVRAMVHGLEKNSFSAVEYSPLSVLGAVGALLLLHVWPWLAVVATSGATRMLYLGVLGCTLLAWIANRRALDSRLLHFLVLPATASLLAFTILRSGYVTLRQGGIRWRDTHYPLAELRANRL